jgi:hypothetical protein
MNNSSETKYRNLFAHIQGLRMKDIRLLFSHMRKLDASNANVLFPEYGFTAGEFTVAYITNVPTRTKGVSGDRNKKV